MEVFPADASGGNLVISCRVAADGTCMKTKQSERELHTDTQPGIQSQPGRL